MVDNMFRLTFALPEASPVSIVYIPDKLRLAGGCSGFT